MTYDVVVVGGRCAGSATALGFARAGRRVLMLEKVGFPCDTISTHHVHQPGLALLQQWGVLDAVLATGCPANERIVYRIGDDICIEARVPKVRGIAGIYAPRRYALDNVLASAAAAAGAEFADRTAVTDVLVEDGRAVGVRYRGSDGTDRTVRTRLVVGADGKRSTVARLTGAPVERTHPKLTCAYYGYWADLPADFEMYVRPGLFVATVLTHDDLTLVAAYLPQDRYAAARLDAGQVYRSAVEAAAPEFQDRLARATPAERLRGTGDQVNVVRRPAGPGWALVGDAACTKDSITGSGITDAFRQADLLVECLAVDLTDRVAVDEGLRTYAARHGKVVDPSFDAALAVGRLQVSGESVDQMRRIQHDPRASALFAAAAAGAVV